MMAKGRSNPDLFMERMLKYREKHALWYIFRSIYWGLYLFVVGSLLLVQNNLHYSISMTAGTALVLLSLMVIVYGFVEALHNKLMRKYG